VVIDDRTVALYATEAWGTTVMQGDATRNSALEAVQFACARPCSLLRDGTTHPIPIVLNPANFAGVLLAGSDPLRAYRVVSTDLAAADGKVVLHERVLTAIEVGPALSEIRAGLGHRIYRGDRSFGICEPQTQRLKSGDLIV
jgi:voltage-gated potassium channel